MRIGVLYSGLALLASLRDAVAQLPCDGKQVGSCADQSYDNCTYWWSRYNQSYNNCITTGGANTTGSCTWGDTCSGAPPAPPAPGPAPGAYPAPSSLPACRGDQLSDNCDESYIRCDGYAYVSGDYFQCDTTGMKCLTGQQCSPDACASEAPGSDCTNIKKVIDPAHPESTCYQYYQPDGKGGYVQCMGVAAGHTPCKASTVSCPGPASSNSSMFMQSVKGNDTQANSLIAKLG